MNESKYSEYRRKALQYDKILDFLVYNHHHTVETFTIWKSEPFREVRITFNKPDGTFDMSIKKL